MVDHFNVDEKNQVYSSYDGMLYSKDRTILLRAVPNEDGVYLPEFTRIINTYAFHWIDYGNIYLNDGLLEIRSYAFMESGSDCITVPGSVEIIAEDAFREAWGVGKVIIEQDGEDDFTEESTGYPWGDAETIEFVDVSGN